MKIFNTFKRSFFELKRLNTIVACAFLLALSIVLGRFSFKIEGVASITFSFIANSVAAMLFGPCASAILGALTDILNHYIDPKGSYFFGFTLDAFLAGIIYGLFLYRNNYNAYSKKALFSRIILAKIIISIFINLGLGTFWYSTIQGKGYLVLLPARIIKELVVTPIHIIILFFILPTINKIKK